MPYDAEDERKYRERMAKADAIQKSGTAIAQFGCMLMIVIPLGLFLLVVIAGALFGGGE